MINLTPPFKAGNMEALYKKIMKGQYARINSRYSRDIANIVNSILLVEPKERPSCDEILKNEMVKERIDFFSDREGFNDDEDNNNETLMKSLRLSKNMRFISQQLPNPNYNSPKNEEKNKNKSDKLKQNNISLPNKQTINAQDIKRLANEIGEDMDDDQAKRIFNKNASRIPFRLNCKKKEIYLQKCLFSQFDGFIS